jgi:pimeloyl-ACP methyl ester carboxylesterase
MPETRVYFPLDRIVHDIGGRIASPGSAALIAKNRAGVKSALVFVHGFGTTAVLSWTGFPEACESDELFAPYDVFFYGYPSKSKQLGTLASGLSHFLAQLSSGDLPRLILADLGFPEAAFAAYDRVTLVGHSMGAVVAREAMLLLELHKHSLINRVSLRFFAPAHAGARLPSALLAAAEAFPLMRALVSAITPFLPASEDLDRTRSAYLGRLRAKTEELVAGGRTALAADCVFGDGEMIVIVDHFAGDRRQIPDPSPHDHFNVVKVTKAWGWPVRFVCSGVESWDTTEHGSPKTD